MMRLLHVAAEMDPRFGGVTKAIQTMIKGLAVSGVENEVVCLDHPESGFLANFNFPVHALGPAKTPWCFSRELMPWLVNNYSRFDIVIVHGLWLYHVYATVKAARKFRLGNIKRGLQVPAPTIYIMPHGMLDPYFQKAAGRKLKAIRNWIYWKLIESTSVNSAQGLLFTSNTESTLAQSGFVPYKPKKNLVVGLGVENPPESTSAMFVSFQQKCPQIGDNSFLLFLSRIHEKKGIDILLQSYSRLIANGKEMPKLVIAGPGLETAYGKMIQEIVLTDKALQKSVFFTGMLTGDAKWGAFYNCEAFILPSHQENFGIAVVEALASKKPVLISNQINIWQDIEMENAGLVADNTLAGTIALLDRWLLLSVEERKQMGFRAGRCFEKNYANQTTTANLLKAFEWN